jgi:hypothetical protein
MFLHTHICFLLLRSLGFKGKYGFLRVLVTEKCICVMLLLSLRFNEKFDFIMIPASSVLLVTVWDQTTAVEAVVSLSVSRVSSNCEVTTVHMKLNR